MASRCILCYYSCKGIIVAKDTCKKNECGHWNKGKCINLYINTFYPNGKADEAYQVYDCAPIRTMLLVKEFHSTLLGIQASFEEQRNKMNETMKPVNEFIDLLKKTMEQKQLEKENVAKIQTDRP